MTLAGWMIACTLRNLGHTKEHLIIEAANACHSACVFIRVGMGLDKIPKEVLSLC